MGFLLTMRLEVTWGQRDWTELVLEERSDCLVQAQRRTRSCNQAPCPSRFLLELEVGLKRGEGGRPTALVGFTQGRVASGAAERRTGGGVVTLASGGTTTTLAAKKVLISGRIKGICVRGA